MPFLAVLGIGAVVGLVGYVGYRAVKHFVFKEPLDITWKGVAASAAAGAVALPLALFGSGALVAAAGVELTPLALGGATTIVGAVSGSVNDGDEKKPAKEPAQVAPPQINPNFNPFAEPAAPVTTATETDPEPVAEPAEPAPVESSLPTLEPDPKPDGAQTRPPEQQTQAPEKYTVQSGDTLSAIARDQGISLAELEKANPQLAERKLPKGYSSPWDYIRTGEQIFMPPSDTPGVNGAFQRMGEPARVTDK
ncbi:MAG: LysM peptidoglycan-binding domain-containing protein [Planctomycetota bacterium]